jgi:hypothetical protein
MKIAFRFENGTSELILTPENARDQQYLGLCMDGKQSIRMKPTAKECTILEFSETKPVQSIDPVIIKEEDYERVDDPGQ